MLPGNILISGSGDKSIGISPLEQFEFQSEAELNGSEEDEEINGEQLITLFMKV